MANPGHLRILRQGFGRRDGWRYEKPHIVPDISGAGLRGMNRVAGIFQYANLQGANIEGVDWGWPN